MQTKLGSNLSKQLSISLDRITPSSNIATDLGADSLDIAEIAMMIKEEFDYDMTDSQVLGIKTVGDLLILLEGRYKSNE